jgi:hypothetical protein
MGVTWCASVLTGLRIPLVKEEVSYVLEKFQEFLTDSGDSVKINDRVWKIYNDDNFWYILCTDEVWMTHHNCGKCGIVGRNFEELLIIQTDFQFDMEHLKIWDQNKFGIYLIMEGH